MQETEGLLSTSALRSQIGTYRLEGVLGGGGMGLVYRGTASDGTSVAVKVLHPSLVRGDVAQRFEREARIRIDHPNVICVLDAGVDPDGTPYIVFERLEGESLSSRLSRGTLAPPEAIDVISQAARGLVAVHAAGVIHRDLKPANLFLCADRAVKVLDFGIARIKAPSTQLTSNPAVLGTPGYLSPEQARGGSEVDHRADIWALGVVLYEALSGSHPFASGSMVTTMLSVVLDDPTPLCELAPDAPRQVEDVVMRCLAKSPARRFPHMADLVAALEKIAPDLAGLPPARAVTWAARDVEAATLDEGPGVDVLAVTLNTSDSEQRLVTILFADAVRSTATLVQAIEDQGGQAIPLLGQRVVGVFGQDSWEGDEMVRAISTALQARQTASWMAVASGRVARQAGRISGDVVRAAEQACSAHLTGIAVHGELARALESHVKVRTVAGGLFEIAPDTPIRRRSAPTQLPRRGMLGRDVERMQLSRAMMRVIDEGRAHGVLVTGPPGCGKTRLRQEINRLAIDECRGYRLMSGRGQALRRGSSFSLLASVLDARARLGEWQQRWPSIDATADPETRRWAVLELTREAFPDSEASLQCAVFLGELLGVPMPPTLSLIAARSDPQLMADHLHLALLDYLYAMCARGPLALVLEDLHWADHASLALVDELFDRTADLPLFVFATARPELSESHPDLWAGRETTRIALQGLSAPDVVRLAIDIAGRSLPRTLLERLPWHTEGNPLFVGQIVSALAEQGKLDEPEDLPLPLTVEGAIQSRLDKLSVRERELCKRASLLGRVFDSSPLAALGLVHVEEELGALCRRGFLVSRRRPGSAQGTEYRFSTPLLGDVAYRSLPEGTRMELHRRAAEFLEVQADVDHEAVAFHFEQGAQIERAALSYVAAALEAARRADGSAVLRCSEQALGLGCPDFSRFELYMARADALRFLGRRDEQAEQIEQAHRHAVSDEQKARAQVEHAVWLARTGSTDKALHAAQQAVDAARRSGKRELLALARLRQAAVLIYAGQSAPARKALDEASELAENAGPHVKALVAEWHGQLAAIEGDLEERRTQFQCAVDLYLVCGDLRRAAVCETNLADTYNRVGAYADAEAALREALSRCRRVGNRLGETALVNLGYSLLMQGSIDEALKTLDQALGIAEQVRDARLSLVARIYRLRASLGRIDASEASGQALRAAEDAERMGLPALAVAALTVAARAELAAHDPKKALTHSSRALSMRDSIGSVEEDEADVFLVHARALEAFGQTEQAQRVRAQGRGRIRELALRIADPVWRDRFVYDVASHNELMSGESLS